MGNTINFIYILLVITVLVLIAVLGFYIKINDNYKELMSKIETYQNTFTMLDRTVDAIADSVHDIKDYIEDSSTNSDSNDDADEQGISPKDRVIDSLKMELAAVKKSKVIYVDQLDYASLQELINTANRRLATINKAKASKVNDKP